MVRLRFILWILLSFGWLAAQNIQITASIDRNPVGLNEQFTYQVEIKGETNNLPEVKLPDFENFAVLSGPNVSTSVQIINFKMSSTRTYSVVLMPRSVGTFRIKPATARYKGKKLQSNAIQVQVVKGTRQPQAKRQSKQRPSARDERALSKALFLKAVPSRRSVFVNEQITVSYKIYFRVNIQNPNFLKLPETPGFWVEEYPIDKNIPITQEVVNGVQYNVAEIRKMALFPSKTGKLVISPMELEVEAIVRRRQRDPFNLFDDFFQDSFGQVITRKLVSNPINITVKPLPEEGKPAGFAGLVGNYRIHASLDKAAAQTDEALSLKIRIFGNGNLKVLSALPLKFPAGFEVYDPKVKENINHSGAYISESKEFEYVIIPRVPGQFTIKSISIPYFNPLKKIYNVLKTPDFTLNIIPGKNYADNLNGSYISKEAVRFLGKDIRFIKDQLEIQPIGYVPLRSFYYWVAIVVAPLLLLLSVFYKKHQEKMSSNVEYARKRTANKMARRRLKEARRLLKDSPDASFYGEISRAFLGYIADKTNRSAAGLLKEDVAELLKNYQVEESLVQEVLKLLDEADFRRFAPSQLNGKDAQNFYDRAEELLVRLEKFL